MTRWTDLDLEPHHAALLEAAAITPEIAQLAQVTSIRIKRMMPAEFDKSTKLRDSTTEPFPGLMFRYRSPMHGQVVLQYRPDVPITITDNGRTTVHKYLQQPGSPVCPAAIRLCPQPAFTLLVEGTKQALAAASWTAQDVQVIGFAGCMNWQAQGEPHPQLKVVAGAPAFIAMDADAETNPQVYSAARKLGEACKVFGATEVRYLRIKGAGAKGGFDDLLALIPAAERSAAITRMVAEAHDAPADRDPSLEEMPNVRPEPEVVRKPFVAPPVVPHGERRKRPVVPCPPIPARVDLDTSKSVYHLAGVIVGQCESNGVYLLVEKAEGTVNEPVYYYRDGIYRTLPGPWLCEAICVYDGAVTKMERISAARSKRDGGEGTIPDDKKWHASPRNVGAVSTCVRQRLMAQHMLPPGESPLRDSKPMATVFTNGVICWDEESAAMRWEAHSPAHRASWGFDFDYEPGLVPEHMLAVMRYSFSNCDDGERDKRVQLLRAAAGVAFLGCYSKVRRSVWMSGNGNDGKGVFTNLVSRCLKDAGAPITHVTPDALGNKVMGETARRSIEGSRANFAHEVTTLENIGPFKSVLQCEEGSGRALGEAAKNTKADCIHFIDSNYPTPKARIDNAWMRRIAVVLFENPIPADYAVDREIDEKLAATQTREFVCWCIDGALEVLANGGQYDLPECHFRGMATWGVDGSKNNVGLFFAACVDDTTADAPKSKLPRLHDLFGQRNKKGEFSSKNCYLAWHSANGYSPRELVPYPEFVAYCRGSLPGVTVEVSQKAQVARIAITDRLRAPSAPTAASTRKPAQPLNMTNAAERAQKTNSIPYTTTATDDYESGRRGQRGGNVRDINAKQDDQYSEMFDNERDPAAAEEQF